MLTWTSLPCCCCRPGTCAAASLPDSCEVLAFFPRLSLSAGLRVRLGASILIALSRTKAGDLRKVDGVGWKMQGLRCGSKS